MIYTAHELVGKTFEGYHIDVFVEGNGVSGIFVASKDGAYRILKIGLISSAAALIEDEREILESLSHPNIVQYLETIRINDMSALVLFRYIKGPITRYEKILSQQEIETIFLELRKALSYLESQGVIHCDIKPENVVLNNLGQPILIDFGAAHRYDEIRDVFYGSPIYAAPEVLNNNQTSFFSDRYSLAKMIFLLVFPLSKAETDRDISRLFSSTTFSQESVDQLTKFLSVDPKQRQFFQAKQEIVIEIQPKEEDEKWFWVIVGIILAIF